MKKFIPGVLILAFFTTQCGDPSSDSELFRPKDDYVPRVHDYHKVFELQLIHENGTGDKINVKANTFERSSQSGAAFTLIKDSSITFDKDGTPCFYIKLEQSGSAPHALYVTSDASLTADLTAATSFSMRNDSDRHIAGFDSCLRREALSLFGASRFSIREW